MAHGSAAAAGQIKIRTVTETDGVSQIGGHRPGRHIPLSLIGNRYNHYQRNRYNHYQRQIEAVQQNGAAPIGLTSIEQTQLACEIPIIPHIPSQKRLFLRDISCESEVGGEKLHVSMPAWLEGIMAPRQTKAKLTKRKTGKPMLDWILKHG